MKLTKHKWEKYFLAILPEEGLAHRIQGLKVFCSEKFETHGALRSPPHITLHMPFRWRADREATLLNRLKSFVLSVKFNRFQVELSGFGSFPPRVIFIAVENSPDLLRVQQKMEGFCRKELKIMQANYKSLGFHPHVTIAFRDLKKSQFIAARDHFSHMTFNETFTVNSLSLLRLEEKGWVVCARFDF